MGTIKRLGFIFAFAIIGSAMLTFWPKYMPWDVNREREKIDAQILVAERKWTQANIENYNIDVLIGAFPGCWGNNATLYVRNRQLIDVVVNRKSLDGSGEIDKFVVDDFNMHPCGYSELLPMDMFERVKVQPEGRYISATFNKDYGYVESFQDHYISRLVDHCCWDIKYSNFVPIEESNNSELE